MFCDEKKPTIIIISEGYLEVAWRGSAAPLSPWKILLPVVQGVAFSTELPDSDVLLNDNYTCACCCFIPPGLQIQV